MENLLEISNIYEKGIQTKYDDFLKNEKDLMILTYKTEDWDINDVDYLSRSPDLLIHPIVDFEELNDYHLKQKNWIEKQVKIHTHQTTRIYIIKKYTNIIEKQSEFFFKLIKLNFLLRCFIRQFNRQQFFGKLHFSKGIILSNKKNFFYAEKPTVISEPNLLEEFLEWGKIISGGKFFFTKSNDAFINSGILIHTKHRVFKELGDNGIDEIKTMRSLAKVLKKCKNLFCNEFSLNEFCQKCLKELEITDRIICGLCGLNKEVKKNIYIFAGKDPPRMCEDCIHISFI